MTCEDLYREIKDALRFFDLRFSEMDLVDIHVVDGRTLVLTAPGRTVSVNLPLGVQK